MLPFRIRIARRLLRDLYRFGITQRIAVNLTTQVGGRSFRVPVVQGLGMGNIEITESWMVEIFDRLAPPRSGVFLDVGANTGQTLLKLRSRWTDTPWVGLEPNPACVQYLGQLIAANGFRACELVPVGLHTEAALMKLDFYTADGTDSSASLVANFRPDEKVFGHRLISTLPFAAIEPFVARTGVAFVKIDVEGGEKEVIETLTPVLRAARPPVLMEILPVYKPENTQRLDRQRAIEQTFRELDYQIFRVEKTAADGFAGLRRLAEIGVHSQIAWSDYLVVPAERAAEFLKSLGEVTTPPAA